MRPYPVTADTRDALAQFLRARRARLLPADVGLAPGHRRRTPGLRREEVAQVAGVGVTWYTWFEQGRDIQVSTDFLERLCRGLRLDGAERAHLFALAQQRPPPHLVAAMPTVSPGLRALLDSLPNPAYVKTARWDVVAWNRAAADVLGDWTPIPVEHRNLLWLAFTEPAYRRMMVEWELDARRMLAKFRLDHSRGAGDPAFPALVAGLERASPEFRRWWPQQDVAERGEGVKRLRHPMAGEIEFQHAAFIVEGAPDLRLVTYTPVSGDDDRRLRRLLAAPDREINDFFKT